MPRSPHRAAGLYRVTFSSDVWKRIGLISSETFHALQAALEAIASDLGAARPDGEDAQSEIRATVAGLVLTYQRDDATRTLTLLDFSEAPARK
jgi:mRNA-degrading endonuclease RelE of RelBE toxin-antitoxin system